MDEWEGYARAEGLLDALLSGFLCFSNPTALQLPPLLPLASPLAADYVRNFPQLAIRLDPSKDGSEGVLLSPTCCYPVFHHFQGSVLEERNLFTAISYCFRNEASRVTWSREMSFRMREYILIAPAPQVEAWIERIRAETPAAFRRIGLEVDTQDANDPFFGNEGVARMIQRGRKLKQEFVADGYALASVNFHLTAFSRKCGLRYQGKHLFSACFGMGYYRVWRALVLLHGVDGALSRLRKAL